MMPQALTRPSESQTSTDDEIIHILCDYCWPDPSHPDARTMCGLVCDEEESWWSPDDIYCVVCEDLTRQVCPGCGR